MAPSRHDGKLLTGALNRNTKTKIEFSVLVSCVVNHVAAQVTISNHTNHQENISVLCIAPLIPVLYSKIGVCRGIPIFLILLQNIDCEYSLEPTF